MIRICGAKTRAGTPCRRIAMKNGRCMNHGGKSTGAKTKAGLERIVKARTKHGYWSKQARALRKEAHDFLDDARANLMEVRADVDKRCAEGNIDPTIVASVKRKLDLRERAYAGDVEALIWCGQEFLDQK